MWRTFSPLLLLAMFTLPGCDDAPTNPSDPFGENIITNGSFATTLAAGGNIVTGNEASPWGAGYGSPQIGAGPGCDSTLGYLQIWGNADLGECAYQHLAEPIRKGKIYRLTACAKFSDDNPDNYTKHARVRFVAFNAMPGNGNLHWTESRPNVAVIGSLTTTETTWKEFTLAEWTADADYSGLAINAENNTPDNNTANTVSWVKVDNVVLKEKKSGGDL